MANHMRELGRGYELLELCDSTARACVRARVRTHVSHSPAPRFNSNLLIRCYTKGRPRVTIISKFLLGRVAVKVQEKQFKYSAS